LLAASSSCLLVLSLAACSGNGGGTDGGGGNVIPCDGGSITLDVTAPDCLWAPDHKMVLFTPDYTYNPTGVCLRAERQGTSSDPRVYTILVAATDGNVTVEQSVNVTVGHDQGRDHCAAADSSRVVDDGDSRCN